MNEHPVIFFDDVCNLCNGAVQFTIRRDTHQLFMFSSLQSEYATQTLKPFTMALANSDSFLLLDQGKLYQRSTAALRVARKLSGLWPLMYVFILIPAFIRDAVYKYISQRRYKWFGKLETCWVPTAELKSRFLN